MTTGEDWQFLRLQERTVEIDENRYYINVVGQLNGAVEVPPRLVIDADHVVHLRWLTNDAGKPGRRHAESLKPAERTSA